MMASTSKKESSPSQAAGSSSPSLATNSNEAEEIKELQQAINQHGAKYIFGAAGLCLFAGFGIGIFRGLSEVKKGGLAYGIKALSVGTGLCLALTSAAAYTSCRVFDIHNLHQLGERLRGTTAQFDQKKSN